MCRASTTSQYHFKGFALLEFLLVVTVIGILMVIALKFFEQRVDQAERVALKSMSRNMAASMSLLRNKWIVEGRKVEQDGSRQVYLDDDLVLLNAKGWPTHTDAGLRANRATARGCAQLWQVIMQTSIEATIEGDTENGKRGLHTYHISAPDEGRCRYELGKLSSRDDYFDYYLSSGKIVLNN